MVDLRRQFAGGFNAGRYDRNLVRRAFNDRHIYFFSPRRRCKWFNESEEPYPNHLSATDRYYSISVVWDGKHGI